MRRGARGWGRLVADFTLRRPDFHLHVQLAMGAEVLVLFGPSGAGKTTTLSAIAGLLVPDRGRICVNGELLFERGDAGGGVVELGVRVGLVVAAQRDAVGAAGGAGDEVLAQVGHVSSVIPRGPRGDGGGNNSDHRQM